MKRPQGGFRMMPERLVDWLRMHFEAHPLRVSAIFITVLTIVTSGLLQFLVNQVFQTQVLPWLGIAQSLPHWFLALLTLLFVGLIVVTWQQSLEIARLRVQANEQTPAATHLRLKHAEGQRDLFGKFLEVSVVVLEALVISVGERAWTADVAENISRQLATLILKRLQRMYAQHISHGSIYVPSPKDPDYLILFAYLNLPERTHAAKWYVGPDPTLRRTRGGAAGKAFITRKPLVRHINQRTHTAQEKTHYIPLGDPTELALHVSMVAVPIVDKDSDERCVGVLCLDSSAHETFDGDNEQAALEPAVRLLAQVLKLYQRPPLSL
jgi:hypothetical protein